MSENPEVNQNVPGGETPPNADNSWQEVGRQFEVLGRSIADAVRAGWENEETQRQVHSMRDGLQSMVKDVEKAIDEAAQSPKGQQIRQDAERAAESLQTAGKQTVQEVRPHLINALQELNKELQQLINRLQGDQKP